MNALNLTQLLVAMYLAVFCEAAFPGIRHWLGAQVDLLPSLMIYAGMSCGLKSIMLLAVVGGLFYDSLSANPLGTSVLPLLLVGTVVHLKRDLILREQYFARFVLGLAAGALVPALSLLLLLTLRQGPLIGWGSLWQWLVMSAAGGVLTPACFLVFDGLNHALNYRPATENSFRPEREIRRGRN